VVLRGHRETTQYVRRCLRHSHWMRSDDDHHVIISRGSVSLCSLSRVTRVQVLTEGGSHCHSTSTFEARAYLLMFVYSDRLELFFFSFFAKRANFKSLSSLATHVISSHNCTPTKEVSTPLSAPLANPRAPHALSPTAPATHQARCIITCMHACDCTEQAHPPIIVPSAEAHPSGLSRRCEQRGGHLARASRGCHCTRMLWAVRKICRGTACTHACMHACFSNLLYTVSAHDHVVTRKACHTR
jgi:hypothetical protein